MTILLEFWFPFRVCYYYYYFQKKYPLVTWWIDSVSGTLPSNIATLKNLATFSMYRTRYSMRKGVFFFHLVELTQIEFQLFNWKQKVSSHWCKWKIFQFNLKYIILLFVVTGCLVRCLPILKLWHHFNRFLLPLQGKTRRGFILLFFISEIIFLFALGDLIILFNG